MFDRFSIHATIPVTDMDRAKNWYERKLDLDPVKEDTAGVWYETGNGSSFFLYSSEAAGTSEATAAAFALGGRFEEGARLLRDRDVEFLDVEYEGMSTERGVMTAPDGLQAAWFVDSEGNILAITNE
jgi:catechol 2,3-dioxygenase-like lactoylglutathione lyase family enzyme